MDISAGVATVLGDSLEIALEGEATPFLNSTNSLLSCKLSVRISIGDATRTCAIPDI